MTFQKPIFAAPPAIGTDVRFDALRNVDWGFTKRSTRDGLEGIHPYPAKFIPDIPGSVLDLFPPKPGTWVLDPFVGSGTTSVESQRRGIASVGIDLNPIACLITRVKTMPLADGFTSTASGVVAIAEKISNPEIPLIPNLNHWFSSEVTAAIARLITAIKVAPAEFHDVLRLALSSILVRVSNQDSDTRYAAVDKNIKSFDVFHQFALACTRLEAALRARKYALTDVEVIERDALAVTPGDISHSIGAVITSPPYPNAYEYWLYHKYRMWWLGHDPIDVKEKEIGARAHFFKKNHHTSENFVLQMEQTFRLIAEVLAPEGYACFVVGRSKIHGAIIDNAKIIEGAAAKFDFRLAFKKERVIAATRKSFNLSHANIKTETVLVLIR